VCDHGRDTSDDVKERDQPWRVDIPQELHANFVNSLKRLGMSQREATIRLFRWYLAQDPDVQALVMQQLTPERTAALARLILREMGRKR
jgi:hypothetical protein